MKEPMASREFALADILSATTGRLVSPRGMTGVSDVLSFVTGENLFTHQLPRAHDESIQYILDQQPILKQITGADIERLTHAIGSIETDDDEIRRTMKNAVTQEWVAYMIGVLGVTKLRLIPMLPKAQKENLIPMLPKAQKENPMADWTDEKPDAEDSFLATPPPEPEEKWKNLTLSE